MFVLIGEGYDVVQERVGEGFVDKDFEERIALFSSVDGARAYAEAYRLKHVQHMSFSAPQVFRRNSPMASFTNYRVEIVEDLEVDPVA